MSKPDFGIKSCEQNISSIPTRNSTKDQSSCVDINNCYDAHNNQVGLPSHAEGKIQTLSQAYSR